jgi:hypothetical protein
MPGRAHGCQPLADGGANKKHGEKTENGDDMLGKIVISWENGNEMVKWVISWDLGKL